MTEEVQSHQTNTEVIQSAPPEVDAGTDIALKVRVSCPSGCDLRGETVRITAQDGSVAKEAGLTGFDGEINETDEFTVKAPIELGECAWSVVFPAHEVGGGCHEESSMPVLFNVKPHKTSMAVWDLASPVIMNSRFKIRVGVKCSAECNLMDKKIGIYGPKGKKVATGVLGGGPWPGTSALYWSEVELEAPSAEGYYRWRVKFGKPDLELPHEGAAYSFAFRTARQPEHVVIVEVIDKDTKTAIKNARVTLRSAGTPYRERTDDGGVARVSVPKGEYKLSVLMDDYKDFQTTAEVTGDATVKAELLVAPKHPW